MIDDDRNVLKRIVTGDESWCYACNPETKRQSVTWLTPKKPKVQKVTMQKSRVKTMLTAFSDVEGIIHHEFVPEKQTVTVNFINRDWSLDFSVVGLSFRKMGPGIFCTTMHRRILRALSSSFWRKEGFPCYRIHPTPLIYRRLTFLFPKLKIARKGT
jgi:hypothetical protein